MSCRGLTHRHTYTNTQTVTETHIERGYVKRPAEKSEAARGSQEEVSMNYLLIKWVREVSMTLLEQRTLPDALKSFPARTTTRTGTTEKLLIWPRNNSSEKSLFEYKLDYNTALKCASSASVQMIAKQTFKCFQLPLLPLLLPLHNQF